MSKGSQMPKSTFCGTPCARGEEQLQPTQGDESQGVAGYLWAGTGASWDAGHVLSLGCLLHE